MIISDFEITWRTFIVLQLERLNLNVWTSSFKLQVLKVLIFHATTTIREEPGPETPLVGFFSLSLFLLQFFIDNFL
jgi:hypothetical protein